MDICKIPLFIGNQKIELLYPFNNNSTFEDLIEFISYNYKDYNYDICPCYEFFIDNKIINKNQK